jgi:hypothetical protein
MIVYATCNGSGGRYDPTDAYLYDWFKTEAEAARHGARLFAAEGGGCIFRVDLGHIDKAKVIALLQQDYLASAIIQVIPVET